LSCGVYPVVGTRVVWCWVVDARHCSVVALGHSHMGFVGVWVWDKPSAY
jgi:hypothetical protein